MKNIQLPMSPETARELKLGELVTVSGLLFTGRSRLHIRAVEEDIYPTGDEKPFTIIREYHDCVVDGDEYEISPEEHTVESLKFLAARMDKDAKPIQQ